MIDIKQENRIEVLRQAAVLLDNENQRLHGRVQDLLREVAGLKGQTAAELQQELSYLQELLAQREQALFGKKSERRGNHSCGNANPKPREKHGPTPQPMLPVVPAEHDLDEPDKVCPKCGGALTEMRGQFEESEEIDVVERHFVVKRHKRKKYRCSCNGCVETAPGPVKLRPGNRYSIDFAVDVAVAKYSDHLPLERQTRIMAREHLDVTTQTLFEQLFALFEHLKPTCDAQHLHILSQPVICADETRWPMLDGRGEEREGSRKWHAWSVCCPHGVSYQIHDNRSTKAACAVLGDYSGKVIADGYGVYGSHSKRHGRYVLGNCWVHARRKFVSAEKFTPKASEVLDLIGELYEIEEEATGPPYDAGRLTKLHELRQTKSKKVVARIHEWALEQRVLPKSAMGKALSYLGKMWPGLLLFLQDPRVPLDTNSVERSLRGVVVGRKNHLGSKSRRGTEVAAAMYTLIESAKLCDVEPKAYLKTAAVNATLGRSVPLPHEYAGIEIG